MHHACLLILDKELDVQKVVDAEGTEEVVDHPLGAGLEEVAELRSSRVRQGRDGDSGASSLSIAALFLLWT